jgi:hypothetical protein
MITKPAVPTLAGATLSLAVCTLLTLSVFDARHMAGRLRREIALAQLEQQAVIHALAAERDQRAAGLLDTLRRPVAPELPLVLRRVPPAVQVEVIRATTDSWQITGVPRGAIGSQAQPYELRLPRPAITIAEGADATASAHVAP